MQDRDDFLAMLSAVVDLAKSQDNIITTDEVKELFDDSKLSLEQMEHVYQYLAANQIRIQGYIQPVKTNKLETEQESAEDANISVQSIDGGGELIDEESKKVLQELKEREERVEQEEASYIAMYLEDLELIAPRQAGELEALMQSLKKGNKAAKERLLEIHLKNVVDIAKEYQGRGIIVGDLIQEGNIGLITALEEIFSGSNRVATEYVPELVEYMYSRIRESMELVINEQRDDKIRENRIVEKINFISTCMNELAEENAREATLDELAEYAKMDKEEIADIIELAKDSLS